MKRLPMEKLESETVETQWDIKRIVVGIVILAFLASLGALMLFPGGQSTKQDEGTLGIFSDQEPQEVLSLPTKEDVEKILADAQDTLSRITSKNLTSSQGAIQKLISDLEVLQGKKDAKDVICDLVCER